MFHPSDALNLLEGDRPYEYIVIAKREETNTAFPARITREHISITQNYLNAH